MRLGVMPFREYLLALADSERHFERGLPDVYHGQLKAYYDAIVRAPDNRVHDIEPYKKAVFYKAIWSTKVSGKPVVLAIDDERGLRGRSHSTSTRSLRCFAYCLPGEGALRCPNRVCPSNFVEHWELALSLVERAWNSHIATPSASRLAINQELER